MVTAITGVSLTAPEAYEVGQRFQAELIVATGSGMSGVLSYGNSDADDNVAIGGKETCQLKIIITNSCDTYKFSFFT